MIEKLFFAALILIPFTSINGLSGLGEIQHEAASYLFILAMGVSIFPVLAHFKIVNNKPQEKIYGLPIIMMVMMSVIGISFVANFMTIKDSVFLQRSGIEKFVSSTILVIYGFGIAYLTYFVSTRRSWDHLIIKPLAISVVICFVFSVFEVLGRVNGMMASVFQLISGPVYGSSGILTWDHRLRSVAFEPPDFANTAGYIWPWLLAAVMYSRGSRRLLFFAIWSALNVMIILSEARTSMVVISGLVLVLMGLKILFLPRDGGRDPQKMILPITLIFVLILPALLFVSSLYYDQLIHVVIAGDNVSNISRLASITAALHMFEKQPIFGFGFGQFGFHVIEYMPSWGYYSWEIKRWLFVSLNAWPSVYSVYARFAADMGILGLIMWVGIWFGLARALLIETLYHRKATGEIPFAAFPLIMSCFCVLLAGIPCDSVRAPMIWVNMGLACRYLVSMREARLRRKEAENQV